MAMGQRVGRQRRPGALSCRDGGKYVIGNAAGRGSLTRSSARAGVGTMAGMNTPSNASLQRLLRLVVKNHVALGGLSDSDRSLALTSVWAGLPAGRVTNEKGINEMLREQLAGPACWLGTDHVELRRWLVDGAWLARDGFGHAYHVLALDALQPRHHRLARDLAGIDTAAFTTMAREDKQIYKQAQRLAWERRQAANDPAARSGASA
jgi:hypothetical protein